jgi:hypothetical protein
LEGGTRGIAGRSFFRGWMRRKTLAETGRPGLLRGLAAFAGVGSLLLVAEGIMVGWFLKHLVASPEPGWPVMRPIDYYFLKMPWVRLPQYLAAACLIMIGAACFMAALSLPGRSRPGTYFAVALEVCLLVTGAILLWQGYRRPGPWRSASVLSTWASACWCLFYSACAGTPSTRWASTASLTDITGAGAAKMYHYTINRRLGCLMKG